MATKILKIEILLFTDRLISFCGLWRKQNRNLSDKLVENVVWLRSCRRKIQISNVFCMREKFIADI